MAGRIWNVSLNLDAYNASFATLDTDDEAEVAAFAKGFHRGLNGGSLKEAASDAMASGFDLGTNSRAEAENKMAKSQAGGQISAANRARKYGTAQPSGRGFEDTSGKAQIAFEGHIEDASNLSIIEVSISESNELPTIEHPNGSTAASSCRKSRAALSPIKSKDAQEAFKRVHALWPSKRPVDKKAAKGDLLPAERAFQSILDAGAATVQELEDAARFYVNHHPRVKEGYVVFISTFYGDEKGLWIEAVRTIRERRAKNLEGLTLTDSTKPAN